MREVLCTSCNEIKNESLFHKNANRKNGLNGHCKECQRDAIKKAERTKTGVLRHIFASQKRNSSKRKTEQPMYTLDEFKDRFIDDEYFTLLFDSWEKSGYETSLKPSFDRVDYSSAYSFDNIKLMTWKENKERQDNPNTRNKNGYGVNKKRKVCIVMENGEIGKIYDSVSSAAIAYGLSNPSDITNSIIRNGTAGGQKWDYI